jgi:branched-chain amino acid transport system permease protein
VSGRPVRGGRGSILGFTALAVAIAWPFVSAVLPGPAVSVLGGLEVMAVLLAFALAVLSLDLITGYAGQVSVGHAGLMALGAYFTALLVRQDNSLDLGFANLTIGRLPLVAAMPVAILMTVVISLLFAYPGLRLRGPFFAAISLVAGIVVYRALPGLAGTPAGTIRGMPPLTLDLNAAGWGIHTLSPLENYFAAVAVVVLGYLVVRNLVMRRSGRALLAIRESEPAAESLGVDVVRYKVLAFMVSAALAAAAGSIIVFAGGGTLTQDQFRPALSVALLAALAFGGSGTLSGAIVGGVVVGIFLRLLSGTAVVGDLDPSRFGALLAGVILLALVRRGSGGTVGTLRVGSGSRREVALEPAPGSREPVVVRTRDEGLLSNPQQPVLWVKNLSKSYGGVVALEGLDLVLDPGTVHTIVGPNGSGKTTLLDLISRTISPDTGELLFIGRNLARVRPAELAHFGIGRTFQDPIVFRRLSVIENVMVGMPHSAMGRATAGVLRCGLRDIFLTPDSRRVDREMQARAYELLRLTGLDSVASAEAATLRFGQRKLLELARALAIEPALLMLDEPLAGLEGEEAAAMLRVMGACRSAGMTLLVSEQRRDDVLTVSDVVTVLDSGRRVSSGRPKRARGEGRTRRPRVATAR